MSTLYTRAAAFGSAVDRARKRKPNNEKPTHDKITEENFVNSGSDVGTGDDCSPELPPELPVLPGSDDEEDADASTLPGSLGKLACELRNAIGIMSEGEMAAILQVSHETLATWRTKRRGPPHVKIGKRAFYLVSDFSQWVSSEVERQAAFATGRKHQRKRKGQAKSHARDKREENITDADAQVSPAIV